MKRLLVMLAVACAWLPGFIPSASAQEARWVESNSWKGNGTRQTEVFWLNGDRYALKHRHTGDGLFQVAMYDEQGRLVDVPVNVSTTVPGMSYLKGRGARYLLVSATEGNWEVTIDQYVSATEEWHLLQLLRKVLPPPKKVAVWVGDDGRIEHEFTIAKGDWKVVATNDNGGRLEVMVKEKEKGMLELATTSAKAETFESWGHRSGTFVLTVKSTEARWKIEILGE